MVTLKSPKEIQIMREGGKILALIFKKILKEIREGVKTESLDKLALSLIKDKNCQSSFLGYQGYPKTTCVSINEEIVHGLPSQRKIKKGDLVKIDLGLRFRGYCLDKAATVLVGEKDPAKRHFLKTVKKALFEGIKEACLPNHLGDISFAIQKTIEKEGYKVIKQLSGHGVGKRVHEEPNVYNFGEKGVGEVLKEGMVLAIEPMAAIGDSALRVKKDGFTFVTCDNSLTCHFEETVAIVKEGPLALTLI